LFIAYATGFWTLFRLTYLIFAALPVLWLWTRSMSKNLEVDISRGSSRLAQGGYLSTNITVRSTSWIPKIWLEAQDSSIPNSGLSRRIFTLSSKGVHGWDYRLKLSHRGLYKFGPVSIRVSDPFGFFERTIYFGEEMEVLVYPDPPDLPNFYLPPASLQSEGKIRKPTSQVTPNVSGVREYISGDSTNRFHWPATARTGKPMVKLFDLDPSSDIWIVLDLSEGVDLGSGVDSASELAILATAAILKWMVMQKRSVGLIMSGVTDVVHQPDRSSSHLGVAMESLALADASGQVKMEELLNREVTRFSRHTTVLCITSSSDILWAQRLAKFRSRGLNAAAILINSESFGGESGAQTSLKRILTTSQIYTYGLARGDVLSEALAAGRERLFQ
jgi:uncharacterized protein (DUF58 family)